MTRNIGLWRELLRSIRVVRPLYAIVENVAALLVRGMGTVLGDLAEIGYDTEWDCIPASAVGAPHQRDRVWITAHPDSTGLPRTASKRSETGARRTGNFQIAELARNGSLSNIDGSRCVRKGLQWAIANRDSWPPEPNMDRVAYGVPDRVDRIEALGNSVVPQIPEIIGKAILFTPPSQR